MSGQLAYNMLTSMNTEEFLKVHGLVIAGSSAEPTAQFRIYDAGGNRYKIETNQGNLPAGAHTFDSYNVPMQVEEENGVTKVCIPVMHGVTLPAAGGPDIVVTGQLSGCSFVYLPLGNGGMKVTHIMPSGNRVDQSNPATLSNGISLAMQIGHQGGFVGNANQSVKVFGSNLYQHKHGAEYSRCSIMGIRRLNGWNFYAQIYLQQGRKVLNTVRFYP